MVSTIKDVAKKAGVSISTVSKVLQNYSNISDKTKQKVLDAVKELNYIPNSTASNLASKSSRKVALFININDHKQSLDEINMQYLIGAFESAKNDMELVTIFNQSVKDYSDSELISFFASIGVNGIIIYGLNKEDTRIHNLINSMAFKCCVIDAPITNNNTSSIMIDHEQGQYDVAKKVIEKDYCHKVLYLAGKRNGYVTSMRIDGIEKLQREYNFELCIKYADFSEKNAYQLTKRYGSDYDTIICASDMMAIGALRALINMNIFRRCSGFDGISLLGYVADGMYTCKQDFFNISALAIKEMEALLNGENGKTIIAKHTICTINHDDVMV